MSELISLPEVEESLEAWKKKKELRKKKEEEEEEEKKKIKRQRNK